ncbi:Unconventional Myosin-Ie [Manis pentadactyla]|nr:Unconventional Myosin-Ie [Manis pentadactyla]
MPFLLLYLVGSRQARPGVFGSTRSPGVQRGAQPAVVGPVAQEPPPWSPIPVLESLSPKRCRTRRRPQPGLEGGGNAHLSRPPPGGGDRAGRLTLSGQKRASAELAEGLTEGSGVTRRTEDPRQQGTAQHGIGER